MKIFDLHCDTLDKLKNENYSIKENCGYISESGLLKGEYTAQCFAIYTPCGIFAEESFHYFEKQLSVFEKMLENSSVLAFAKSKKQLYKNQSSQKVSAILTVENAEFLDRKIERIKYLQDYGTRLLGLVHNGENCLGFAHKTSNAPLKSFGKTVVEYLNDTNILVDVSHLNYRGFFDVARISKNPIIASHSACFSLQKNSRNLQDDQIIEIAKSGGVVGVPFYAPFLNGSNITQISDIINHFAHLIKVGGEDVAAFGTDFDGMQCEMFLKNCEKMQPLVEKIIKKFGYSVAEKICFKNAIRIF